MQQKKYWLLFKEHGERVSSSFPVMLMRSFQPYFCITVMGIVSARAWLEFLKTTKVEAKTTKFYRREENELELTDFTWHSLLRTHCYISFSDCLSSRTYWIGLIFPSTQELYLTLLARVAFPDSLSTCPVPFLDVKEGLCVYEVQQGVGFQKESDSTFTEFRVSGLTKFVDRKQLFASQMFMTSLIFCTPSTRID